MSARITRCQNKVLGLLAGKVNNFYLGGGTPLAVYYFHHRDSADLDFFTKIFDRAQIAKVISELSLRLKKKINIIAEPPKDGRAKVLMYSLSIDKRNFLKIDFIEDYSAFIKKPRIINGIKVLSLEDIYMRKIHAITGTTLIRDGIGRNMAQGGRQEAKDFYDLFCLSSIFMSLSKFSFKHCTQLMRESIIRWFRSYDRLEIKAGLLELKLRKEIDFNQIERHFKKEIDKILEKEVDFV